MAHISSDTFLFPLQKGNDIQRKGVVGVINGYNHIIWRHVGQGFF